MARARDLAWVGGRLRLLRERLGLRRVDVAKAAAISPRTLARLESGLDVQLSSYLAVIHYYLTHGRIQLPPDIARKLPPEIRELLIGLLAEASS